MEIGVYKMRPRKREKKRNFSGTMSLSALDIYDINF